MKRNFVIILSVCIALLVTVFCMNAVASNKSEGLSVTKEKISKGFEGQLKQNVYICHSLIAKVNTGKTSSAGVGRENSYNFLSANKASEHSLVNYTSATIEQRLYLLNCAHLL